MNIELKETLEVALKSGLNLFLGAGFSIHSKNKEGKNLPYGSELTKELIKEFQCPSLTDLSKVCTIIDSYNSEGLKDYLLNRFRVFEYESFYNQLALINSPRIFTTNIDNLVDKIFEKTNKKYINNVFINGACFNDTKCVDYIPIHGSVDMPDIKFLFNKQEVSGSYRTELNAWINLNNAANQLPSVFLGYSLEDVGAIESLFGSKGGTATQKNKWILLHKEDPGNEAYFKALGFKIMIGTIKEFLQFAGEVNYNVYKTNTDKDSIEEIFPEARIPKSNYNGRIRQIDEFFLGSAPIWSDILSNRIHQTHHLDIIANLLEKPKSIIVSGIPASGKSTLLLQLAKKISNTKRVLYFSDLTLNKSNIIRNEIKSATIILIDNFTTDVESFLNLAGNKNIKLVGFDRYYNIDISIHKLSENIFETYDVSDLNPQDIQGIYNSIPLAIRKNQLTSKENYNEIPSVFELVNYNIIKPDLNDRYKNILIELNDSNPILFDLLVMTAYVHSCRVPVSFDVVNSFLSNDISSYHEVSELMQALHGMVQEAIGDLIDNLESNQDYYQPRSQILAETIISQTKAEHFKEVYEKFHENVPKHLIPNFHVFKRQGYDASYVAKAYNDWKQGLEFYETAYQTDKNPFLLQQCSLYLMRKKRYTEAALKIDQALQSSYRRFFSIENTHAIILFKANINANSNDPSIRATLDKSMQILKDCYKEDQRKTYHAFTFGEQALEYFTKYPDKVAKEYLILAKEWIKEVYGERKHYGRSKVILDQLTELV